MRTQCLIGRRFERWTVIKQAEPAQYTKSSKARVLCRCDCGAERIIHQANLLRGGTKSCGCLMREVASATARLTAKRMRRVRARGLKARFLSRVQILPNGCWFWLGNKIPRGYGALSFNGKRHYAHRISLHLFEGFDLNSPLQACHRCDNPSCVNPAHLFPGTSSDNMKDAYDKGRQTNPRLIGESNPHAKLNEEQVREICIEYQGGNTHTRNMAKKYGVSRRTIQSIIYGKSWRHVSSEVNNGTFNVRG